MAPGDQPKWVMDMLLRFTYHKGYYWAMALRPMENEHDFPLFFILFYKNIEFNKNGLKCAYFSENIQMWLICTCSNSGNHNKNRKNFIKRLFESSFYLLSHVKLASEVSFPYWIFISVNRTNSPSYAEWNECAPNRSQHNTMSWCIPNITRNRQQWTHSLSVRRVSRTQVQHSIQIANVSTLATFACVRVEDICMDHLEMVEIWRLFSDCRTIFIISPKNCHLASVL